MSLFNFFDGELVLKILILQYSERKTPFKVHEHPVRISLFTLNQIERTHMPSDVLPFEVLLHADIAMHCFPLE